MGSSEATRDLTGSRLGGYLLEARIGGGGFGEVYRAKPDVGPTRAIKILPDRGIVEALRAEAETLLSLKHPCIVELFQADLSTDPAYLVMELAPGGSLAGKLPIEAKWQLATVRGILEGLAHAHSKGVAHLDLKPANILVGATGPKIADFGLARRVSGSAGLEHSQASMVNGASGSLRYMAPEQREGRRGDLRSDVYSFGLLLAEIITGRLPEAGDTLEDLLAASGSAKVAVPAWAVELFRGCYTRYERRFPSAVEALAVLQRMTSAPPVAPSSSLQGSPSPPTSGTANSPPPRSAMADAPAPGELDGGGMGGPAEQEPLFATDWTACLPDVFGDPDAEGLTYRWAYGHHGRANRIRATFTKAGVGAESPAGALYCVGCKRLSPLKACENCRSDSYALGPTPLGQLGVFCDRCKRGFTEWKCPCGCVSPAAENIYVPRSGEGRAPPRRAKAVAAAAAVSPSAGALAEFVDAFARMHHGLTGQVDEFDPAPRLAFPRPYTGRALVVADLVSELTGTGVRVDFTIQSCGTRVMVADARATIERSVHALVQFARKVRPSPRPNASTQRQCSTSQVTSGTREFHFGGLRKGPSHSILTALLDVAGQPALVGEIVATPNGSAIELVPLAGCALTSVAARRVSGHEYALDWTLDVCVLCDRVDGEELMRVARAINEFDNALPR